MLTSACANRSISLNEQQTPQSSSAVLEQRYFGFLSLNRTQDTKSPSSQVLKISGLGLRWGTYNALGYFEEIRFTVPSGCKVVVLVRNEQEALSVSHILKDSLKESPCTVLSPS